MVAGHPRRCADFRYMANKFSNKFFLGTKGRMTQVFDDAGSAFAATIITAAPMTVTQVKTTEKDGYQALQVGIGSRKAKNLSKPVKGHLKDIAPTRYLREIRTADTAERGAKLDVTVFAEGDVVAVSAISKGKGFQGVVKRHGFAGGPRSHGQKHSEREPGSIGAGGVQKVLKGTRMAGRMGGDRVTVKNLRVLHINPEKSFLVVKGAVPGRRGTLVEIRGK